MINLFSFWQCFKLSKIMSTYAFREKTSTHSTVAMDIKYIPSGLLNLYAVLITKTTFFF